MYSFSGYSSITTTVADGPALGGYHGARLPTTRNRSNRSISRFRS